MFPAPWLLHLPRGLLHLPEPLRSVAAEGWGLANVGSEGRRAILQNAPGPSSLGSLTQGSFSRAMVPSGHIRAVCARRCQRFLRQASDTLRSLVLGAESGLSWACGV